MSSMIYLDSNIFLYAVALDPEGSKLAASSRTMISAMTRGELDAATSALTWDEVFWVLKRKLGRAIAAEECAKFLGLANLQIFKVGEITIRKAQEIAEIYGLDQGGRDTCGHLHRERHSRNCKRRIRISTVGSIKRIAPGSLRV